MQARAWRVSYRAQAQQGEGVQSFALLFFSGVVHWNCLFSSQLIMAGALLSGGLIILLNQAVDLAYGLLEPRIRLNSKAPGE